MRSKSDKEMDTVKWASVLFEPLPGSNERIAIAVATLSDKGDSRCLQTLSPEMIGALFRDERRYVRDVVLLLVESLESFLKETRSFEGWTPPVVGASLGNVVSGLTDDLDGFTVRAASMTSFFYTGNQVSRATLSTTRPNWHKTVSSLLIDTNERLKNHIDAKVFLSNHEVPAVFTFLSPSYATNLVTFTTRNLKQRIEDARAKAWSLNLLSDAPSFLIRPERRELLVGIDNFGAEGDGSNILEAIEEVTDEAARRSLEVVALRSPQEAVDRILLNHNVAATTPN